MVICPAFVCDCIETIHEISVEYKEEFIELGGEKLDLVSGLNDHPLWIEALTEIVMKRSGNNVAERGEKAPVTTDSQ